MLSSFLHILYLQELQQLMKNIYMCESYIIL